MSWHHYPVHFDGAKVVIKIITAKGKGMFWRGSGARRPAKAVRNVINGGIFTKKEFNVFAIRWKMSTFAIRKVNT